MTYQHALKIAAELTRDGDPSSEYRRGIVELLADLFDGLAPMMDDRIPIVSADLSRVEITDPARS